jgi:hypothetical protein
MIGSAHTITVEEARQIAEASARRFLQDFVPDEKTPFLEEGCLEAENCWFFFGNRGIDVPLERSFSKGAYAVSKRGTLRLIADLSDDPERLIQYLQTMSDFFGRNDC